MERCELLLSLLHRTKVEVSSLSFPLSRSTLTSLGIVVDSNYLSTLLTTYRTFCTSHTLLDLLIQRFEVDPPMGLVLEDMKIWETSKLRPIRARSVSLRSTPRDRRLTLESRVANVIKSWVREHMDHDEFDPDLLRRIAEFATGTMRDPVQSPQIIKVVEERVRRSFSRSSTLLTRRVRS